MTFSALGRLLMIVLVALLSACADEEGPKYVERQVDEIYNNAVDELDRRNYALAAKLFDEVERQHPYSIWATKAQLMAGFAHYQANDYGEAIIALDRFIQLHPGNQDIAYAYYLKAQCYYEQISDIARDQLATEKALDMLVEVTRRFPGSKYARDARLKIDLTRDHLAGKDMDIGRYYLRRGHYLAAINRFRRVIAEFQTTTHVPEALHRLVEAYTALGIVDEARKSAAVLGHNYPGSEWYSDSYALAEGVERPDKEQKGFLARAWDWVF
jgi:outer membrane protein assembly factor BamD